MCARCVGGLGSGKTCVWTCGPRASANTQQDFERIRVHTKELKLVSFVLHTWCCQRIFVLRHHILRTLECTLKPYSSIIVGVFHHHEKGIYNATPKPAHTAAKSKVSRARHLCNYPHHNVLTASTVRHPRHVGSRHVGIPGIRRTSSVRCNVFHYQVSVTVRTYPLIGFGAAGCWGFAVEKQVAFD